MNTPHRILLINPNTTQDVTQLMRRRLLPLLSKDTELVARTATFGAPYIACEATLAVASHAVLVAWAQAWSASCASGVAAADELETAHPFDAVLIGCFGDPGLFALRECCPVPVTGLAEASFIEASRLGPFAIVTGGLRWKVMLERLAQALGFGHLLVQVETVVPSGAELRADPALAQEVIGQACRKAQRSGARSVIVGGAGLAGLAARLQPQSDLPLIDSVEVGLKVLLEDAAPRPILTSAQAQERLQTVLDCTK